MKILRLNEESLANLVEMPEAGMDFHLVTSQVEVLGSRSVTLATRGAGLALPIGSVAGFYSLPNLLEGVPVPKEEAEVTLTAINHITAMAMVNLPNGYGTAVGAHQLIGSITLANPTSFFRLTSSTTDYRFSANTLKPDTYLTSINDRQLVNSGFGAVGRYALPLPLPASTLHDYTLPAGTKLLVGTVAPLFGQSGGGVEVKTISSVASVALNSTISISDY